MTEPPGLRLSLVTAARNEARFIELTIRSVIAQTVRPLCWVIVSDGSTDGTDGIVSRYAAEHGWIRFIRVAERPNRSFAGKAAAFKAGYDQLGDLAFDVIGNLDADVSFEDGYFEFLLSKFADNPKLGVAGTPYVEEDARHDERFKSPEHVSGACQLFRRECFESIGGYPLVPTGGIDLIALLRAQSKGWETRRFDEQACFHHRNVGSAQDTGVCRRMWNLGRKDYLLGSHPVFEVFRATYRIKSRPYVLGGSLMLLGYWWAAARGLTRSMPDELVAVRRVDQMRRLKDVFRHPLWHLRRRRPVGGMRSGRPNLT